MMKPTSGDDSRRRSTSMDLEEICLDSVNFEKDGEDLDSHDDRTSIAPSEYDTTHSIGKAKLGSPRDGHLSRAGEHNAQRVTNRQSNYKSYGSRNANFSIFAFNAIASILVINGALSILSINSLLCIASINSALSIGSANSLLSVGCHGKFMSICTDNWKDTWDDMRRGDDSSSGGKTRGRRFLPASFLPQNDPLE